MCASWAREPSRVSLDACAPSPRWPAARGGARSANASTPMRGERRRGRSAAARVRRRGGSATQPLAVEELGAGEVRPRVGCGPSRSIASRLARLPPGVALAASSARDPRASIPRRPVRCRPRPRGLLAQPLRAHRAASHRAFPVRAAASIRSGQRPRRDEQRRACSSLASLGRRQRLVVAAGAVVEDGGGPACDLDAESLAPGDRVADGGLVERGGLVRPSRKATRSIAPDAIWIPVACFSASQASPEVNAAFMDRIPLRRAATTEDITTTALFLASDEATYVTGVNVFVDGGWEQSGYPDLRPVIASIMANRRQSPRHDGRPGETMGGSPTPASRIPGWRWSTTRSTLTAAISTSTSSWWTSAHAPCSTSAAARARSPPRSPSGAST